ncbi:GNAT family N-acetyltransferase [Peribacillus alkalitolerans]|uniref:GNAT family N-acetyltransferase n=1 Tax=Peribacillus alkalitolerans TaxID=1550385 RepID=UPI0013D61CAC|nr:GNAT family N-acetyltransferase [Peribacillus alkalitolerans]
MKQILDLNDNMILDELFLIQQASYMVEANLINFYDIPPLKESKAQLKRCNEAFIGWFVENKLAGAVSYTKEGHELAICRLIVHPDHFRKGIASKLLEELLSMYPSHRFIVSTGKDNTPAKRLYEKKGFRWLHDLEAAPRFYLSFFER